MAKPLEIFRAGTHQPMNGAPLTFSDNDLRKIATDYDPKVAEAPIVVGHPTTDAPAYGWVEKLQVVGDVLMAVPKQVEPAFAEIVNAGRYKRISASFYRPDTRNNPLPGRWYLKHVGFLGAAAPAVSGLKSVAFGADEGGVVTFGAIDKGEEAAFYKAEFERMKTSAFLEEQIREGRLLPAHVQGAAAFMAAIGELDAVSFAAGEDAKETPLDWFKRYVRQQPKVVTYGRMPELQRGYEDNAPAAFAAPRGHEPNPASMALHEDILAEAKRRNIPYVDALKIVAKRQKA